MSGNNFSDHTRRLSMGWMSEAQRVSAQFSDDGMRFTDDNGNDLASVCEGRAASVEWLDGHKAGPAKYIFPDQSVITIAGSGWDYGFAECFCWKGAGHADDCRAAQPGKDDKG